MRCGDELHTIARLCGAAIDGPLLLMHGLLRDGLAAFGWVSSSSGVPAPSVPSEALPNSQREAKTLRA